MANYGSKKNSYFSADQIVNYAVNRLGCSEIAFFYTDNHPIKFMPDYWDSLLKYNPSF